MQKQTVWQMFLNGLKSTCEEVEYQALQNMQLIIFFSHPIVFLYLTLGTGRVTPSAVSSAWRVSTLLVFSRGHERSSSGLHLILCSTGVQPQGAAPQSAASTNGGVFVTDAYPSYKGSGI